MFVLHACYAQEHRNGWYGTRAYYAAKVAAETPMLIVPPGEWALSAASAYSVLDPYNVDLL
jgi:hypothetical protein